MILVSELKFLPSWNVLCKINVSLMFYLFFNIRMYWNWISLLFPVELKASPCFLLWCRQTSWCQTTLIFTFTVVNWHHLGGHTFARRFSILSQLSFLSLELSHPSQLQIVYLFIIFFQIVYLYIQQIPTEYLGQGPARCWKYRYK